MFLVICALCVGSSAYGDQIMLQFIVQHQPQITLENLKEVIHVYTVCTEPKQWLKFFETLPYVSLVSLSLTVCMRSWLQHVSNLLVNLLYTGTGDACSSQNSHS